MYHCYCTFVAGLAGFEPTGCRSQSPVPYRLATAQRFLLNKKRLLQAFFYLMGWKVRFELTISRATIWRPRPTRPHPPCIGAPRETRTPDLLLRRQLLYPAELLAQILLGAGDGNRTHATSLEGWDSTIELHPRVPHLNDRYYYIVPIAICQHLFADFFAFCQKINGWADR